MGNQHRRDPNQGLDPWLTTTVILVVLGLLAYSVIRFGVEGYPLTMFLGGIIGAYAGLDRAVRRKNDDDPDEPQPPAGGGTP